MLKPVPSAQSALWLALGCYWSLFGFELFEQIGGDSIQQFYLCFLLPFRAANGWNLQA